MPYTVQEYFDLPEIHLPWHGETMDVTLSELNGHCAKCDGSLDGVKGRIYELGECVEINFAGICQCCRVVTTCRMRWYPKQHRVMFPKNGNWISLETKFSILRTVWMWIRGRVKRCN